MYVTMEAVQQRMIKHETAMTVITVLDETETGRAAVDLLMRTGALRTGDFTLASGKKSDYYFDSKRLTLHHDGAKLVAKHLTGKLGAADAVGGMALSAIPIVAIMVHYGAAARGFYVRDERKSHGTKNLIEGQLPEPGSNVVIIDDVVTTGASVCTAIRAAEAAGCTVTKVIALLDRNEGGSDALRRKGYNFEALYSVGRTPDGNLAVTFNP